jgi:hypothetical protein
VILIATGLPFAQKDYALRHSVLTMVNVTIVSAASTVAALSEKTFASSMLTVAISIRFVKI